MIIQIVASFIATTGFGILFGLEGKKLFFAGLSGGIGWFVYLLAIKFNLSEATAFLLASFAMTLYSELMARKEKAPAIVFLIGGFIPLVPGNGVYYTMYGIIKNDISFAVQKGIQTLIIGGAITVGILLGSTITQAYYKAIKQKKNLSLGGKK